MKWTQISKEKRMLLSWYLMKMSQKKVESVVILVKGQN